MVERVLLGCLNSEAVVEVPQAQFPTSTPPATGFCFPPSATTGRSLFRPQWCVSFCVGIFTIE